MPTERAAGPQPMDMAEEDEDIDTDASTEIEVAEQEEDLLLDDETTLGVLSRLLPRQTFWDTFTESQVVKMTFLCGADTIGSFTMIFMKYGTAAYTPLFTLLFIFGIPLLCMEVFLGQYTSQNPLTLYKRMVPALEGLGHSITILNFILIGAQVQQAALYTGLLIETASVGSRFKGYDMCMSNYNNDRCKMAYQTCPSNLPLLLDNQCTTNTSYKYNLYTTQRFRGILGEENQQWVRSDMSSSGVITYSGIWLFLLLVYSSGSSQAIKTVSIITNTAFIAYFVTFHIIWRFYDRPFIYIYPEFFQNSTNWRDRVRTSDGTDNNITYQYAEPHKANRIDDRVAGLSSIEIEHELQMTKPPDFAMWISVGCHILTSFGLGDGGILTIASHQTFSTWILFLTAVMFWDWSLNCLISCFFSLELELPDSGFLIQLQLLCSSMNCLISCSFLSEVYAIELELLKRGKMQLLIQLEPEWLKNVAHSSLSSDAFALAVGYAIIPIGMAYMLNWHILTVLVALVRESRGLEKGREIMHRAFDLFVERSTFHTSMFSWAFGMLSFKDYDLGLLLIFSICGLLLTISSVLIRFEIIVGSLSEQLVGQPITVHKCLLRAVIFIGFMFMLVTTHQMGLFYLEAFYKYGLVMSVGMILTLELILVLIYGPRRVFANMNAMQLSWPSVRRSIRLRRALEVVNIVVICSWVLVPFFVIPTVITNFTTDLPANQIWDEQYFSSKVFGFLVALVVLMPVVYFLIKRVYLKYRNKTSWRMEWRPTLRLWGPRNVKDRVLAGHVELEFGINE
ncbi:unnamed protein product, partial [Mesorhabditis spiculigera]